MSEVLEVASRLKHLSSLIEKSRAAIEQNEIESVLHFMSIRFECLCGKEHALAECEAIQTHWYESPSGCMGGDTWHTSEILLVCPDTLDRNRVYFKSKYGEGLSYDSKFGLLLRRAGVKPRDDYNKFGSGGRYNGWFEANLRPVIDLFYPPSN